MVFFCGYVTVFLTAEFDHGPVAGMAFREMDLFDALWFLLRINENEGTHQLEKRN